MIINDVKSAHKSFSRVENLIEDPNFTISGWLRDTMTIIMKQDSLRLGISAARITKFFHFIHSRIRLNLISSLLKYLQGK